MKIKTNINAKCIKINPQRFIFAFLLEPMHHQGWKWKFLFVIDWVVVVWYIVKLLAWYQADSNDYTGHSQAQVHCPGLHRSHGHIMDDTSQPPPSLGFKHNVLWFAFRKWVEILRFLVTLSLSLSLLLCNQRVWSHAMETLFAGFIDSGCLPFLLFLRRKQVQKFINIQFRPEKVYFSDIAKWYRFNITKHCPQLLLGYFGPSGTEQPAGSMTMVMIVEPLISVRMRSSYHCHGCARHMICPTPSGHSTYPLVLDFSIIHSKSDDFIHCNFLLKI